MLKLGTENNLLQEESLKLEWQPKVQFFPDGHNETFQTPFQLQPLVVLPEGRQPNDWDGEVARLLKYLHSNQMICKQSQQMGNDVDSDGGWDICFEPKIGLNSTDCLVYSVGIGYEWSFDEAMAAYGCDVIAFDPSMKQQSHRHSKRVLFQNFGLWDRNTDTYSGKSLMSQKVDLWKVRTLEGLMAEMNHQHKRIDILKIDIEGAEWEVLYQMLERGTLQYVKQLVFEVHVWKPTPGDEKAYFQKKYSILKWLEEQGFRMWNWHWNHLALGSKLGYNHFFREPCCYELSWINTRFNNWWQFEMGVWQQS
ncbi:probable methyltransferase-like protein 24 [Ptychodera flava]|uniref:probable methyltransferase-like protein 24 n=1 Tax=Ptychodera flava TaxID=63121 RepID=UPI00396A842B